MIGFFISYVLTPDYRLRDYWLFSHSLRHPYPSNPIPDAIACAVISITEGEAVSFFRFITEVFSIECIESFCQVKDIDRYHWGIVFKLPPAQWFPGIALSEW